MTWTQRSRTASLEARQARREAERAARGLPYRVVGAGRPRRGRGGQYVPRGATPLEVATLEVRWDKEHGYVNPAASMVRTQYKLRANEFEIYRTQWSAIMASLD